MLDPLVCLGQHYFVTKSSGGGIAPKWDFTSASEMGHPNAFVIGAPTGDIPAPMDPQVNIDWMSLEGIAGDLGSQVFSVQTSGGQPPTSVSLWSLDKARESIGLPRNSAYRKVILPRSGMYRSYGYTVGRSRAARKEACKSRYRFSVPSLLQF